MTTTPSHLQMVNRSNSGHLRVLRAVAAGVPVAGPETSIGTLRGLRTVAGTLRAWGTVDAEWNLTDRGRDLLAALETRRAAAR
jgi:hypothetical protein